MRFRGLGTFCKLLQRQTYSCLSTKYGIWFCLGGIILVIISALHFGEISLEWSMQKYSQKFDKYYNNIGGKSFQNRLCLPEPIDIVYTWVNGSDEKLIKELSEVKKDFIKKLNDTLDKLVIKSLKHPKHQKHIDSKDRFKWIAHDKCPYLNCIPFPGIAIIGIPRNMSISHLRKNIKLFSDSFFLNFKSPVDSSIRFIGFNKIEQLSKLRNETLFLFGKPLNFTDLFITSTIKIEYQKLEHYVMIHDIPDNISKDDIKSSFNKLNIKTFHVEFYLDVALIKFISSNEYKGVIKLMKGGLNLRGRKSKLHQTTFAWKPLSRLELGFEKHNEDISSSRFADNDELKYSLRSIEKFAPWIRNIYIVTNGQIPSWLNLENPRIKIVTHEDIFLNKSHLPTFSSPSIEVHIHRIKGLSKKFIYMNDDVFFGDYVWPDDFYTHTKGHKIYLTWPVPNCNEGCPATWINDKYCDKACNVSECDWDGGDCLGPRDKQKWQFGSHGWQGQAYSAIGEYCNGGCANNWIGDRYCDANCNALNCGFDAGDCGLLNFYQLLSITLNEKTKLITIPQGIKAFYINLTNIFQYGVITEGDYGEFSVMRNVIISKKFKLMSVTLYTNFSTVGIPVRIIGFRDMNKTQNVELNFNISVNTVNMGTMKTTTNLPPTAHVPMSTKNFLYPSKIYNISNNQAHWISLNTSWSRPKWKTRPADLYEIPFLRENISLPKNVQSKIDRLNKKLKEGDITNKGFNRTKAIILKEYIQEKMEKEKIGRHLLAVKDNSANLPHRIGIFEDIVSKNLQVSEDTKLLNVQRKKIRIIDDTKGAISLQEKLDAARNWKHHHLHQALLETKQLWEQRYGPWDPLNNTFATSPFPWERHETFRDLLKLQKESEIRKSYETRRKPGRVLLDTFANSLLHVSRIYNRAFGYHVRKVPAHMPHLIDKNIAIEMQSRFWPHFDETSSHKIRSSNDMQFAFSYNYYLFGVPALLNFTDLFQELDTDHSGALSDRELRTLASRLYSLPLDLKTTELMESILKNCSKCMNQSRISKQHHIKESYFDPEMSLVTKEFLEDCPSLLTELNRTMKGKTKYKFETIGDEDVTFKMIRNNVSYLIFQLDWIRKNKRKFVCLNDNIEHDKPEAETIRVVLKDFYESMFPFPSQFELSGKYRNKYLYMNELRTWKENEKWTRNNNKLTYLIIIVVLILLISRKKITMCIRRCWCCCIKFIKGQKNRELGQTKLYTI